jgi:hypothetical protein
VPDPTKVTDILEDCKAIAATCITVAAETTSPVLRRSLSDTPVRRSAGEFQNVAFRRGWYPNLQTQQSLQQRLLSTHLPQAQYIGTMAGSTYLAQDGRTPYAVPQAGVPGVVPGFPPVRPGFVSPNIGPVSVH